MDEESLEEMPFPRSYRKTGNVDLPDMAWVHRKLKQKGVTRYLCKGVLHTSIGRRSELTVFLIHRYPP